MFSIDKDPTVLAVFPKQETEVNEYSNITIMFSRPMVALSTLSENADITPPVDITPVTTGRWKWITTRTLEFIPVKRLMRTSHYTVTVKEGLHSTDGVAVPVFTHAFTTRTLSYYSPNTTLTTLTHNQPIRIYFNQPIDLEKTRPMITLRGTSPLSLPFVASYGTRVVFDQKSEKTQTLTDQSILEIYPDADTHGRKYLWDFGATYAVSLSGAVPLEGDIALSSAMGVSIRIEEIISGVTAKSPRSNLVTPEIFDPTGTLTFAISEPIDLHASTITGKGITTIAYGEKCKEPAPGTEIVLDAASCEKENDQKNIVLSFDPGQFTLGETSSVILSKLVNTEGITLTTLPLTKQFTTYPKFAIVATTPKSDAVNAPLENLQICSTNPITEPPEKEFYTKVRSNMMIGKWDWGGSYLINGVNQSSPPICPNGTFLTTIRYGLVPKFAYELTLDLDDHFGQHAQKILHFTTKDADPLAKGFVHMQPTVLMTPPERTTLTYGLDFMNEVDMTICKVSPETMLKYRVMTPEITDSPNSLECIETRKKHLTLPQSYATRKYFQVDIHDHFPETLGNYVVVFSNPDYRQVSERWDGNKRIFTSGKQLFEKTYVTVTRLAVGSKEVERVEENPDAIPKSFMNNKWPSNLYWVNDFKTLAPSVGAIVTPYVVTNNVLVQQSSKKTDAEGIALTPSTSNIAGALVQNGEDSAIISNSTDALSYAGAAAPARREYIYTDRPIYRPGDTVHVKGISRIGYDAVYETDTGSTTVEIRDAKYETARTEEVHFGKNGTYEMSFTLDSKASLGYYQISTGRGGYGSFQVEEYVAPEFRVDVAADKEEYISGETAKLNIAAKYYFGVPVETGDVEYRIVAQDYYFDRYQDGYFNFGSGWYQNDNGWYGDKFITSGKLKLGKGGATALLQELSIDKLFTGDYRNRSKLVTIHVTVKNQNGQSVSSQKSFILHRGMFYAGLTMDDYFFVSGKQGVVKIKTVDTKGAPIQKDNLTLTLNRIDWKSYKRQEVDGNFYYRTEQTKTRVSKTTLATDKHGNGSYQFTAGSAGEYEFTVDGTDELGNTVSAKYELYVSEIGRASCRERV